MDDINNQILEEFYLLKSAVTELAELSGHSSTKPISPSLFCLEQGITFDEKGKIILLLNKLLSENKTICYSELKEKLVSKVPKLNLLSEEVFEGMITIFAKIYVIDEED